MREIKFRAWDKKEKSIITASTMHSIPLQGGFWFNSQVNGFKVITNDYILMQFTGLKDKNGKEIYEGDILKLIDNPHDHEYDLMGIVEYNFVNCSCCHGVFGWGLKIIKGIELDGLREPNRFEVIGNIYENPKLLEEKK